VWTVCCVFSYLMTWSLIAAATDRASVISYDEGLKSGLTPVLVRRADKYGGGFFVNVEGMHHLHCLVGCPRHLTISLAQLT